MRYRTQLENLRMTVLWENPEMVEQSDPVVGLPLHTHSYAELFYCFSEMVTVCTASESFFMMRGDMLIVPPGIPHHCLSVDAVKDFCVFGFLLEKNAGEDTHDLYSIAAAYFSEPCIRLLHGCGTLYGLLCSLFTAGAETDPLGCCRLAQFLNLLTETESTAFRVSSPAFINAGGTNEKLLMLDSFLNSCFNRDLSTEKLASMLFLSKRQLIRIVSERYGTTPHRILISKRLESAARLLTETDASAESIGYEVGFRSKSSFYREFMKKYSMTPVEYRKKPHE